MIWSCQPTVFSAPNATVELITLPGVCIDRSIVLDGADSSVGGFGYTSQPAREANSGRQ